MLLCFPLSDTMLHDELTGLDSFCLVVDSLGALVDDISNRHTSLWRMNYLFIFTSTLSST